MCKYLHVFLSKSVVFYTLLRENVYFITHFKAFLCNYLLYFYCAVERPYAHVARISPYNKRRGSGGKSAERYPIAHRAPNIQRKRTDVVS